jgi:hypothetical protein
MLRRLLLASTLLVSSLSFACPNWQANIKNNQPAGWDYQLNPQDMAVVADPVGLELPVLKLTITPDSSWPNGHTRTEVKHDGCSTDEGEQTFLSWEFYLEKPTTTLNNIAYWETVNTYQQSMGFYLEPKMENGEISTELAFFSSLPERKTHWQETVKIGTWNKIALAITWSELEQRGRVSIWFNHQPILTQLIVKTKPDANKLFIQFGLHRNQAESTIDSIYLRNVREADSLAKLSEG